MFGQAAAGIARAADYLTRTYTLVATNPPFLGANQQSGGLAEHLSANFPECKWDLANAMLLRWMRAVPQDGGLATVTPNAWTSLKSYADFRRLILSHWSVAIAARLGPGAFTSISGEVVQVILSVLRRAANRMAQVMDASTGRGPAEKAIALRAGATGTIDQAVMYRSPSSRLLFAAPVPGRPRVPQLMGT